MLLEEFCDYWGFLKGIAGGLKDNRISSARLRACTKESGHKNVASADTMKEAVKQVWKRKEVGNERGSFIRQGKP